MNKLNIGDYVLYDCPENNYKEYGIIIKFTNNRIQIKTLYALTLESEQYVGHTTDFGKIGTENISLVTDEKELNKLKKIIIFQ